MKDKISKSIAPIKAFISRESKIVLLVVSALCIGYVFFATNKSMTLPSTDEARFETGKNNLQKFKFDENAISQLRGLKSENDTSIESNITNNRVNPFIQ